MMMAEQGGRLASMSPEGGVFDQMAGKYSKNGTTAFDVYLKGHAGDALRVDRCSRTSLYVERPRLTAAYAVQPAVLRGIAANSAFRDRGLLGRFLYASPGSLVGRRLVGAEPVPESTRRDYGELVRSLAALGDESVLTFTPDADRTFRDWECEIEAMLADGGALESIRDWGAKLAGATARLTAVMHCVQSGASPHVHANTVESAIQIGRYLIPHAVAVLTSMGAAMDSAMDDGHYLLKWICRHELREFTRRDAHQHGKARFPRVEDMEPGLNELIRRGFVRLKLERPARVGRPPSPTYEVNPVVIVGWGDSPPNSHNPQNGSFQADATGSGNSGNSGNSEEAPRADERMDSDWEEL